MRAGIRVLQRRLDEVRAFDPESVQDRSDPRISSLESAIDDALVHVFGPDTVEYQRDCHIAHLDTARYKYVRPTQLHEVMEGLRVGKDRAVAHLEQIIRLLEEKIQDAGADPAGRARAAFADLDLHPAIRNASESQLASGHYADAVRTACLALNIQVQAASGRYDKDGTDLMLDVFSPKRPTLTFNDLKDETDQSEQQGMMFLYAGAMLAMRNPPSHKILVYDAERAVEAIAFVSFLAKQLARAKKGQ